MREALDAAVADQDLAVVGPRRHVELVLQPAPLARDLQVDAVIEPRVDDGLVAANPRAPGGLVPYEVVEDGVRRHGARRRDGVGADERGGEDGRFSLVALGDAEDRPGVRHGHADAVGAIAVADGGVGPLSLVLDEDGAQGVEELEGRLLRRPVQQDAGLQRLEFKGDRVGSDRQSAAGHSHIPPGTERTPVPHHGPPRRSARPRCTHTPERHARQMLIGGNTCAHTAPRRSPARRSARPSRRAPDDLYSPSPALSIPFI